MYLEWYIVCLFHALFLTLRSEAVSSTEYILQKHNSIL